MSFLNKTRLLAPFKCRRFWIHENLPCQGWVMVRAIVNSNVQNGTYNDSLDVTISAYGIEKPRHTRWATR